MIVYFSGTGNSRFAAQQLAGHLQDEWLDAGIAIKNGERRSLSSEKPWVFVAPTYAWQLPRLFADYIQMTGFSGSKDAYFVLTCGGEIGNAGACAEALCKEKSLRYRGIFEVVMPENYIAMFDAPEEAEARRIVEQALPVIEKSAVYIQRNEPFPPYHTGVIDRLKSGIVNAAFYKLFVKANAFAAGERCTGCGACVEACPLNNISLMEGKPVWGKTCTHCMACICGCPTESIEYGTVSRGKPRYRCPEV